jgi:hypothetical protein
MYVDNCETLKLIQEDSPRVPISKDIITLSNKFSTRPRGFIITDSYNNPFFPIFPTPYIDSSKFNLKEVFARYREKYMMSDSIYLPWHFCAELVDDRYYIFNTRPIDLKFPLTMAEYRSWRQEYDIVWDDITESFFNLLPFNIEDAIHICIIGNTNADVYTKTMYSSISTTCILPFIRQYNLFGKLYQDVFPLNINNKKFNTEYLLRFMR